MKKVILFLCLALVSGLADASEPANLAVIKQGLIRYHDSGDYLKDIHSVDLKAIEYLSLRLRQSTKEAGKPAIVLDIDETSLSNYSNIRKLDFGGTLDEIRQEEDQGLDSAIDPTLKLYRFAKAHQVAVFFITGRYESEREVTAKNLQKAGFDHFDGLFLRSKQYEKTPAAVYKVAMRKQLIAQGYDVLLNMGDQKSDLAGGYADKTFKLPNPYYLIP